MLPAPATHRLSRTTANEVADPTCEELFLRDDVRLTGGSRFARAQRIERSHAQWWLYLCTWLKPVGADRRSSMPPPETFGDLPNF